MSANSKIEWTEETVDRFWTYVRKGPACWEWTGGRFQSSLKYGQFRAGKRKVKAHRFAWEITFGPVPNSLIVCHHCDNPICVRPDHLFVSTHAGNVLDRDRKGRTKNGSTEHAHLWRGERNPAAKINPQIAASIRTARSRGCTYRAIASTFSISVTQARNIVAGRSWRAEN